MLNPSVSISIAEERLLVMCGCAQFEYQIYSESSVLAEETIKMQIGVSLGKKRGAICDFE